MLQDKPGILTDELGLGKTAPAIAYVVGYITHIPRSKQNRILLVLPANLVSKWFHEFKVAVKPKVLRIAWAHPSVPTGVPIREMGLEQALCANILVVTYGGLTQECKDLFYEDKNQYDKPQYETKSTDRKCKHSIKYRDDTERQVTTKHRHGKAPKLVRVLADEIHNAANSRTKHAQALRAVPRRGL